MKTSYKFQKRDVILLMMLSLRLNILVDFSLFLILRLKI